MAETYELTKSDLVDILAVTLAELAANDHQIAVRPSPAKNGRPDGIMIFCGGFDFVNGLIVPQKVEA